MPTIIETVTAGIASLFMTGLGFKIRSLEKRVLDVEKQLESKVDKHDLAELIDLKQEVLKQMAKDTREDVKQLNSKLDRLIDRYIDGK